MRTPLWSACSLCFVACVRSPITPVEPRTFVLTASFDEAWMSAVIWFATQPIAAVILDRDAGFLQSDEVSATDLSTFAEHSPEGMFDCGAELGVPRAMSGITYMTLTILIEPVGPDTTAVRIEVRSHNVDEASLLAPRQPCASRGVVEQTVFRGLVAHLQTTTGWP